MFANGPGDLDSIPGRVIPKTLWYLIHSNIRYVSRIKWSNPGKGVASSSTPQCSSYWKGSLIVALDYGRLQFIIHIYIYIYIYIQIYVHIYMHIYIHVHRCMHIYIHFKTSGLSLFHPFPLCSSAHIHIIYDFIYIYASHIHEHTHTYIHTYIHICIYMHLYMNIYMH